jgi:hypothetical protein
VSDRQHERQSSNVACASFLATAPPRTVHSENGLVFREYQAASELASVRLREVGLSAPETELTTADRGRAFDVSLS